MLMRYHSSSMWMMQYNTAVNKLLIKKFKEQKTYSNSQRLIYCSVYISLWWHNLQCKTCGTNQLQRCPAVPTAVHTRSRHPGQTETSVLHLGWSVCSCRQTAHCWLPCFLRRRRPYLEWPSCRRHFSTLFANFQKTSETASLPTFLPWLSPII